MARPRKSEKDWQRDWAALLHAFIKLEKEGFRPPPHALLAERAGMSEQTARRVLDHEFAGSEEAEELHASLTLAREREAVRRVRAKGLSQRVLDICVGRADGFPRTLGSRPADRQVVKTPDSGPTAANNPQ